MLTNRSWRRPNHRELQISSLPGKCVRAVALDKRACFSKPPRNGIEATHNTDDLGSHLDHNRRARHATKLIQAGLARSARSDEGGQVVSVNVSTLEWRQPRTLSQRRPRWREDRARQCKEKTPGTFCGHAVPYHVAST